MGEPAMGACILILAAWIVGSSIVLLPSIHSIVLVEVLASAVILSLNIWIGHSLLFALGCVAIFVVISSICCFGTALCAAMIAYGSISDPARSDADI